MSAVPNASSADNRMRLSRVVGGVVPKPLRIVVYGVDGIGKSTFASQAPAPIFLGAEDGTSTLDVQRFPEPRTWSDVHDALRELESSAHDYRTLVIDSLDWLEPLCWRHIIAGKRDKNGRALESIEDLDYGKGYSAALDEWRVLCAQLDRLRSVRNMQSILIAHAWIKSFKNPEGEDFDRYELKLHAKAAGLIREWSDVLMFAREETYTHGKKNERHKGISTGVRILHTQRAAAYDAKNRCNLPPTLPLDWQAFADAVALGQTAAPAALRARIEALLPRAPAELQTLVRISVDKANDNAAELARIENKLAAQLTLAEVAT